MKLTPQQQQWLKDYLGAVFTYREVYEEVYDHIALELENHPLNGTFEATVQEVIDSEFGGSNGLMNLEECSKTTTSAEIKKQHWINFTSWFKLPKLFGTIMILLCIIYIAQQYLWLLNIVLISTILMFLIPVILLSVRGFRTGYYLGSTKSSLKDDIFKKIAYRPIIILMLWAFISNSFIHFTKISTYGYGRIISDLLMSIMFLLIATQVTSFHKLYKSEFKTHIIPAK